MMREGFEKGVGVMGMLFLVFFSVNKGSEPRMDCNFFHILKCVMYFGYLKVFSSYVLTKRLLLSHIFIKWKFVNNFS